MLTLALAFAAGALLLGAVFVGGVAVGMKRATEKTNERWRSAEPWKWQEGRP